MTDNKPTYTVRISETGGAPRYYAAFVDGSGARQEVEINREIYLTLEECRRDESRQQRSVKRHQERLDLTEEQLADRIAKLPVPMEEMVTLTMAAITALAEFPENQRRRFLLYYKEGLSYEQIGVIENCSKQAIAKSIGAATTGILNYFNGEG